MRTTRRNFLKLMAVSGAGTVAFAGCAIPEQELEIQAPIAPPEDLLQGFDAWYATQCSQCSAGCGLIVRVMEGRAKKVEGNPDHPLNTGKSCVRSQAAVQGLYHPDRITNPLRRKTPVRDRGVADFEPIKWEEALTMLADKLRGAKGTDAVVMLTEPLNGHDGLIMQKLAQNLGAQHLALEPLEAGVEREAIRQVYGTDQLPDYDIRNADVVLSFGADWLSTWGSPVRYERAYGDFRQGRQGKRGMFFHAESRFSMTAANADKWLPVKPGMEGVLAYAIASAIVSRNFGGDRAAIQGINQGGGLDDYRPEKVARNLGLDANTIYDIAEKFAKASAPLAIGGGSAAAQSNGLFNMIAIHSLNVLVGNLGKAGGVRFNPAPVAGLPANAGGASLQDWVRLSDRIANGKPNPVQVVMVHGANPVYELPNALDFRGALARAPFIVSFSTFMDETTAMADLILPDNHPLERWGSGIPTPGPGYPIITFQQPVVRPQLDTRATGDVLLGLAKDLGADKDLPWTSVKQAVQQTAEDLWRGGKGKVVPATPGFDAYWYQALAQGGWWDDTAATATPAFTPKAAPGQEDPEFAGKEEEYPFALIPFVHNSLGAGEGANLPWLQAAPDPITTAMWQTWVEINPEVAKKMNIAVGDYVEVTTPQRKVMLPAYINPATPPETLAIPMGQGHWQYGRWAYNRGINPMTMVEPLADKGAGGLAWAATRAKLAKAGGSMTLPLLEGDLGGYAVAPELHEIVQITRL
jgi:anaerobic selenocysteine-containing dehydrogenase